MLLYHEILSHAAGTNQERLTALTLISIEANVFSHIANYNEKVIVNIFWA